MHLDVIKSASKVNYEISSVDFISVEVRFQTVSENVRLPSTVGGVLGAVVGVLVGVLAYTCRTLMP